MCERADVGGCHYLDDSENLVLEEKEKSCALNKCQRIHAQQKTRQRCVAVRDCELSIEKRRQSGLLISEERTNPSGVKGQRGEAGRGRDGGGGGGNLGTKERHSHYDVQDSEMFGSLYVIWRTQTTTHAE